MAAGIDIFEKYGGVNQLESLSGGDVTKWESLKAIDLITIFTKLRINRDREIFGEKLRQIKQPGNTPT